MITKAPRGVEDWFKNRLFQRKYIEKILSNIADCFGATQIATPIFEHTILFQRGVGETTDIVQKEMYTFCDKGGRSITLKPEGTASVMRAFLEHSLYQEPFPCKLYYITPAFRYEKPQSGRLRQHHQFGVEIIGSSNYVAELEVIMIANQSLKSLGIKNITLNINNIGDLNCRNKYNEALKKYLSAKIDKLCPICKNRMEKNPLRILDCKENSCIEVMKDAPQIQEYLDDECKNHFENLKDILDSQNIKYVINDKLVRGLDYYTKCVFEFVDENNLTICGGGRYDNLIKEIDEKRNIASVGFGMGIERLMEVINRQNIELPDIPAFDLYIGHISQKAFNKAYLLALELRKKGFKVEVDCMQRSLKAQMKYADKIKTKKTLIIGEDELLTNQAKLKNMTDGSIKDINLEISDLEAYLK